MSRYVAVNDGKVLFHSPIDVSLQVSRLARMAKPLDLPAMCCVAQVGWCEVLVSQWLRVDREIVRAVAAARNNSGCEKVSIRLTSVLKEHLRC